MTAADPEYWIKRWEDNSTGWHKSNVNSWLFQNVELLTGGRDNIKIFVPLSGKSVDLKWFSDLGHDVVGVEVTPKACQEFFDELSIPYSTSPIPNYNGTLYKSKDEKIKVYCCSIFDFTCDFEGQFDAIWDRGSMVALPHELWKAYHAIMESLMNPGCQYILEKLVYIIPGKTGPPHCIPTETIEKYFGPNCNIVVLERFSSPEDKERFKAELFDIEMIKFTKK